MPGDRLNYQAPSIFTTTTPQVKTDDGSAEFLRTSANVFLNNANEAHKRQIASDLDLAQREGNRVGFNAAEKFKPIRNGSMFARQFNESGLYMASQKISMQTQQTIKKLSAQHQASPETLQKSLEEYRDGFASELPEEMQGTYQLNFDQLSSVAVENALSERRKLNQMQAAADFYTYDREVTNTLENIAPLSFRDGPEGEEARKAIATLRQNYVEALAGNGPMGEYSVGGYNIARAEDRSEAFTPEEIEKKIVAFDKNVISSGVLGNFKDEADQGKAIDAYMSFVKGDLELSILGINGNEPAIPEGMLDGAQPSDQATGAPTQITPIDLDAQDAPAVKKGRDIPPPRPDMGGMSGLDKLADPNVDPVADLGNVDDYVPPLDETQIAPEKPASFNIPGVKSKRISDILTNDELEEISSKMRQHIGGIQAIEEGEFKKFNRNRDMFNEELLREAYMKSFEVIDDGKGNQRVIGGDPNALQNIISVAVNDPLTKPDTIDKLQKLASELGTGQIDNPVIVGKLQQGIATGEISSYRDIPAVGVSDTTRVKMYSDIDSRNKGQHWTNSTRYGVAERYADAVLAPEKSAGFSLMGDPNSQSAADRAEWNRRMIEEALAAEAGGLLPQNPNSLPGKTKDGRDEFDFVKRGKEIADEIASKRKAPDSPEIVQIDTEIKQVEDQMNNPKPGDDPEAVKARYRELQNRRNTLQLNQMMGAQ